MNKVAQTRRLLQGFVALSLIFLASFLLRDLKEDEVPGFAISLRLVNESGETFPCAGTLWRESDVGRQASRDSTEVCEDGLLRWHGVEPGQYRLMTQAEGKELFEQDVEIRAESIELGEIVLKPGRTIEGQVLLAGKPIEGALVLVEGGRRTQSDADGHFFFRGLPTGPLALRAAAQAGRGSLELSASDSRGLVVRLERGRGQGLLGLRFERKGNGPIVTGLLEGTAAAEQLERGDLLLKVDGVEVCELSVEEIGQILAGEIGSLAVLEIERARIPHRLELRRINPVELTEQ